MIVYADTSALAKLLLDEDGSAEMQAVSTEAERTASAAITYVELRAALAAAIRGGRVSSLTRDSLVRRLEDLWDAVSPVVIDRELYRYAGDLAEQMHLRACDAIHLTALQDAGEPGELVFACWDSELRDAARTLGYQLLPA